MQKEPMVYPKAVSSYVHFGKTLYKFLRQSNNWGNLYKKSFHLVYWRRFTFSLIAILNSNLMGGLLLFFESSAFRKHLLLTHPSIMEQATRRWFFYRSTMQERISILRAHFCIIENRFSESALQSIYVGKGLLLWSQDYKGDQLTLKIDYNRTYRKEGLMSVTLNWGVKRVYLATFWFNRDKNGHVALWVGALQGAKGEIQTIRNLTKHFYGYRPKNLIIHVLRIIASQLGIDTIYAVSNYGFQASHHFSSKRRLKTSLDEFWLELNGEADSDLRFFRLPVAEQQKDLQEVEAHKRNSYRKRFALLTIIDTELTTQIAACLKKET